MNVVTSTWHQLVSRRLWPVAVLLVVALAAVPLVLAREPEAEVPAPAPVGDTNLDDSLATPVVAQAAAGDRDRRRRVLGARKDPFEPAEVKQPEPSTQQATAPGTGGSDEPGSGTTTTVKPPSFPATSGGGGAAAAPSPLPYPVPAPTATQKKTYPAGSVVVRFGDAKGGSLERMLLPKLAPLGGSDGETPLLIYMGPTKDGKRARFLVDASVEVDGDGVCKPHPSSCEEVELAVGETEFLDVFDPEAEVAEGEDPEPVAQYQLDLVDIKRKGDADVK